MMMMMISIGDANNKSIKEVYLNKKNIDGDDCDDDTF